MSLSVVGRMRLIIAAFLVLSVALGGLTWALTVRIGAAQAELARTSMVQGYLERINGLVYAVVMDSRGVYMAKTPEQVDRFGKGLEGFLGKIGEARQAIETAMGSDRPPAYAEFARQLEAFTRLRLELVAAGRKEGAEAARVIGDNEANRATRMAFNKAIDALAEFERTKMAEGQAALQSEIALYRTILAAFALLMVAGGIGCWFWLARSVGTPLGDVLGTVRALASGDLSVASRHAGRKDEIGALAGALETFRSEMAERAALEGTARAEATARDRRARTVAEAIAAFDRAADAGTQAMARASGDLHSAALTMSSAAEQTRQQVGVVADASGLVTDNIHALARTGEELAGAVAEIAHRVSDASGVAAAASGAAQATSSKVRELSEAAATIGGIIDLINSIAAQTNLLALNATIEAARAGDAGRGFAIVAAEVKQLAAQTTKATDEITSTVGRVQAVTEEVIGAIQEIEGRIADVSGLSTSVAAAVEEQRASTEEIAQSVRMAATGAQQVTGNIAGVNEAATSTGDVALKVLASAQALSEQSTAFRAEIDRFLQTVRAA